MWALSGLTATPDGLQRPWMVAMTWLVAVLITGTLPERALVT
jgi:hypothetical protein